VKLEKGKDSKGNYWMDWLATNMVKRFTRNNVIFRNRSDPPKLHLQGSGSFPG